MTAHTLREEARAMRSSRQRVAELLADYPNIPRGDVEEIVTFMRTGRHLDIGLLTSNQAVRPKLDAFMEDHKHRFRVGLGESAVVIGAIGAAVVVCGLIWEILRPLAA